MPRTDAVARSYAQQCGIATALDVIGDRWAVLILRDLLLGPLRFGELVDGLPGIGTNTLTARLKHLEGAGVVRRQLLPHPDRGTVYELTPYGREVEPTLMALGRWGTKSMGRLAPDVASRSRWLVAGMLAFHDERRRIGRTTTWELRLSDGAFTVRAEGTDLAMTAGSPDEPDAVITVSDEEMHRLLTHQVAPSAAVASGAVTVEGDVTADGDVSQLSRLLELFAFPALEPVAAPGGPGQGSGGTG